MKACGFRGMFDIDFRYDARDGQYKVLDVNPRVGATFRLFAAGSGMDVVRAMYLDMTGQASELAKQTHDAPDGRRWLVEDCDMISSFQSVRNGTLSIRDWVSSLRGVKEIGVFSFDDPLPAFWMGFQHVRNLAKLAHRCQPEPMPVKVPMLATTKPRDW